MKSIVNFIRHISDMAAADGKKRIVYAFLNLIAMAIAAGFAWLFVYCLGVMESTSVILGIFLSVAVAFVFGVVVQWISRLIFTFNYKKNLKWMAGVFGGIATTAIVYFALLKGLKGSTMMTPELVTWTNEHTWEFIGWCFLGSTLLMQLLHILGVNVFKIIIFMGTFALAMAFAGNDLVNFVGVPLAAYSAYQDFTANGAGNADTYLMGTLNESAKTPFIFLLLSGVIMVYSLATSKKAKNVIKTSVDLSRQDEGEEMFGSSRVARSIVRGSNGLGEFYSKYMPVKIQKWIDARFNKE